MCIVQFSDGITFTFNFVDNTRLMTLYVDRCILQPVQTCMLMLSTIVSTIYFIIHNIISVSYTHLTLPTIYSV